MTHYSVVGDVLWAKCAEKPAMIPNSRPRGRKAEGLRYEKAVFANFPSAFRGPWFQFADRNGLHWCSPDIIFGHNGVLWVLEVKYSLVEEGFTQMERLYLPVLRAAYGRPVRGIQVCKVLRSFGEFRPVPWVATSIADAMASETRRTIWHWPGESTFGTHLPGVIGRGIDSSARA